MADDDNYSSEELYGKTVWNDADTGGGLGTSFRAPSGEKLSYDENGNIEGFTPLSAQDVASKGLIAKPVPSTTDFITRSHVDESGTLNVNTTPRVVMELSEPARAAEAVRHRPVACQKGSGKHTGPAVAMLTVRGESDLVSHPYALCSGHVRELQEKFKDDNNFVLTPISKSNLPKLHDQSLARRRSGILSMESALRSGGYQVDIPADAPVPPEEVTLPKQDLLYGRKTESFGVRGPSLTTHLDRVKERRSDEEQETILNSALDKLRTLGETSIEDADPEVKPVGRAPFQYSFKPANPEGVYRNYSENSLLLPPGVKGGRKPSTVVRNKREHPGTNEPNTTWESVGYGDQQSIVAALPAHLQTSDAGVLRPLTPVERFVESRSDTEATFAKQLEFEEANARKLRAIQAAKSMTPEERAHLEREIRARKSIEFNNGLGEIEDPK